MTNQQREYRRTEIIRLKQEEGKTLKEIADIFELSKERIRQILTKSGIGYVRCEECNQKLLTAHGKVAKLCWKCKQKKNSKIRECSANCGRNTTTGIDKCYQCRKLEVRRHRYKTNADYRARLYKANKKYRNEVSKDPEKLKRMKEIQKRAQKRWYENKKKNAARAGYSPNGPRQAQPSSFKPNIA